MVSGSSCTGRESQAGGCGSTEGSPPGKSAWQHQRQARWLARPVPGGRVLPRSMSTSEGQPWGNKNTPTLSP